MTKASGRGTYLLLLHLPADLEVTVGRLGAFSFRRGWYTYAGSALGPGGLTARLARHRRARKTLHWHVDYLLAHALLVASWQVQSPLRLECAWAEAASTLSDEPPPVPGFGASDCGCAAHLSYFARRPRQDALREALARSSPAHVSIHRADYGDGLAPGTCTGG